MQAHPQTLTAVDLDTFLWTEPYLGTLKSSESLPLEASKRTFLRLQGSKKTAIAMICPPPQESIEPFQQITRTLYQAKLPVAQIFASNPEQHCLLMQDLGDTWLWQQLNPTNVTQYYTQAIDLLVQCYQSKVTSNYSWPHYSKSMLADECALFPSWYATIHCQKPLSAEELEAFNHCVEKLIVLAQAQPRVWVHRDFHARNLMPQPDTTLAMIDTQDAVIGPLMYDIVSLLKDCYCLWPQTVLDQCFAYFCSQMIELGLLPNHHPDYQRWFDWMGLQRHLKVLGIFARLAHRDHKTHYLNDLPRVWHYALSTCIKYPELAPLLPILNQRAPCS
jgi:N-acetylmuramate 1-kinase